MHIGKQFSLIWLEAQSPLMEAALLIGPLLFDKSSGMSRSCHGVGNSVEDREVVEVVPAGWQVGRTLLHLHLLLSLLPLNRHSHSPTEKGTNRLHLGFKGLRAGKGALLLGGDWGGA